MAKLSLTDTGLKFRYDKHEVAECLGDPELFQVLGNENLQPTYAKAESTLCVLVAASGRPLRLAGPEL